MTARLSSLSSRVPLHPFHELLFRHHHPAANFQYKGSQKGPRVFTLLVRSSRIESLGGTFPRGHVLRWWVFSCQGAKHFPEMAHSILTIFRIVL